MGHVGGNDRLSRFMVDDPQPFDEYGPVVIDQDGVAVVSYGLVFFTLEPPRFLDQIAAGLERIDRNDPQHQNDNKTYGDRGFHRIQEKTGSIPIGMNAIPVDQAFSDLPAAHHVISHGIVIDRSRFAAVLHDGASALEAAAFRRVPERRRLPA